MGTLVSSKEAETYLRYLPLFVLLPFEDSFYLRAGSFKKFSKLTKAIFKLKCWVLALNVIADSQKAIVTVYVRLTKCGTFLFMNITHRSAIFSMK